jgi:curved DNA-binding protein CbpA
MTIAPLVIFCMFTLQPLYARADINADNYYEILEVSPSATTAEIKAKSRELLKRYHPDTNGGDSSMVSNMRKVVSASQVLTDPQKRAEYDFENGISRVEFDFPVRGLVPSPNRNIDKNQDALSQFVQFSWPSIPSEMGPKFIFTLDDVNGSIESMTEEIYKRLKNRVIASMSQVREEISILGVSDTYARWIVNDWGLDWGIDRLPANAAKEEATYRAILMLALELREIDIQDFEFRLQRQKKELQQALDDAIKSVSFVASRESIEASRAKYPPYEGMGTVEEELQRSIKVRLRKQARIEAISNYLQFEASVLEQGWPAKSLELGATKTITAQKRLPPPAQKSLRCSDIFL